MSFDIHIPTPEKRILSWDGPGPEMGVSGWYRFVLKNRDGSVARDTGWFKNVVTDVGMTRIVDYDGGVGSISWGSYLAIGDGTGTPSFTDTGLFGTQLGNRKASIGNVTGSNVTYVYRRSTHRWPVGEGTGTISEVAFFADSSGGEMFSHALLVDSGGSPTSLVKGADQSLDVYYELRNYPNTSDVSGTIDISGVSYDYVLRPYAMFGLWGVAQREVLSGVITDHQAYDNQALLSTTSTSPTGDFLGYASSATTYAKNTGPYYTDNYVEANIDNWIGTIEWVRVKANNSAWQFTLDKTVGGGGLVKTDEERLRLHIRLTVARH